MLFNLLVLIARLHCAVAYYAATCYKRDAAYPHADTRCSTVIYWQYIEIYKWLAVLRKTTGDRYKIYVSEITHDNPTPSDIAAIISVLKEQNIEFKMVVTTTKVSIYGTTNKSLDLVYYARKAGWTVHKVETACYRCFGKTTVLAPYC